MNFAALGITVTSTRDAGTLVQYSFSLPKGREEASLSALLSNMVVASELALPDPQDAECEREVRRTLLGYETKRGCHGAYGTWRAATPEEAKAWLLPGALAAAGVVRPGYGASLAIYKGANGG
jgi:hypothetical protein